MENLFPPTHNFREYEEPVPDWLTHNDGEEVRLFKVEQVRGDTGILGL